LTGRSRPGYCNIWPGLNLEEVFFLSSPEETRRLGFLLGKLLNSNSLVAFIGNLGAGKTCLIQGLARGLGVPDDYVVTSPSFTLANEYPGRVPLFHLDVYRLDGGDFLETGLDEYFLRKGVVALEWADKVKDILPQPHLEVELSRTESGGRRAVLRTQDERYKTIIRDLKNQWN